MAVNNEIRIMAEGVLNWIAQAPGSGYYTGTIAANPPFTGANTKNTMGYVQAGMTIQQPRTIEPIYDRGTASHFKQVKTEAGRLEVTLLAGITSNYPPTATAANASATLPLQYIEWKQTQGELANTGLVYRFFNCTPAHPRFTEQERGNQVVWSWNYTTMDGGTASGYLA